MCCWVGNGRCHISDPAGTASWKVCGQEKESYDTQHQVQGLGRVQPHNVCILFFYKKLIPKIEFLDLSHNGVLVVDNLQVMSWRLALPLQVLQVLFS